MVPPVHGYCKCGDLRFELKDEPLFVHTCHCLDCKRKTGSSFGLTCIVLQGDIVITQGTLRKTKIASGKVAHQCSSCFTTIHRTSRAFPAIAWLQTGCLDDLRCLKIGAHTWVKRKDDWLQLPEDVPQFKEGYDRNGTWPASSLSRLAKNFKGAT